MLVSMHVKNLALIEEAELEFGHGLNILTGETGAGKSILIGSINLALGAKADKDLVRDKTNYALVELVFYSEDQAVLDRLTQMDLPILEDGTIIITRRLQDARSSCKVNGETVTTKQVKELSELLIDIHGQHEHQSLLHKKNHLEILDSYCGEELTHFLEELNEEYGKLRKKKEQLEETRLDEASRKRELDLAQFEADEIEEAHLVKGEDEKMELSYTRMSNYKKIMSALSGCYQMTGYEAEDGAGNQLGRGLREIKGAIAVDERAAGLADQLTEIDGLLNDFNRDLSDYMSEMEFDEADFSKVQERLNLINHLKEKYGNTLEAILSYQGKVSERIERLSDYEHYVQELNDSITAATKEVNTLCAKITSIRKKHAKELEQTLVTALEDLNFMSVTFQIAIAEKEVSANGADDVEFMISTNPGEKVRPLGMVASGGELSRIMLAIKTVLAGKDAIDTLIFDEIDTGISGKTAWRVSEKMGKLAQTNQILCITHLPQIAAMADQHFAIEKKTDGSSTQTQIEQLSEAGSITELSRLLGSDEFSQAARENALDMRKKANEIKKEN